MRKEARGYDAHLPESGEQLEDHAEDEGVRNAPCDAVPLLARCHLKEPAASDGGGTTNQKRAMRAAGSDGLA